MGSAPVVSGLVVILGCHLAGQFLATALAVPMPGPLLGLVLFLAVLIVRSRRHPDPATGATATAGSTATPAGTTAPRPTESQWGPVRAAEHLLAYLPLFFVPAGVGVVEHLGLLGEQWWPVLAGMAAGWLSAVLVTVVVAASADRLALAVQARLTRVDRTRRRVGDQR